MAKREFRATEGEDMPIQITKSTNTRLATSVQILISTLIPNNIDNDPNSPIIGRSLPLLPYKHGFLVSNLYYFF